MTLERHTRLGRYVIRQRLAGGGMGVVYRARDVLLGREVALKTILPTKEGDAHSLSRFRREAISIAQIDHPNIVSLIDFVEGDPVKGEISYMVMEYLRGKDLGKVIKEQGPLEISRAVDRVLEVCAAVGACHRRGYLHRDLKPTNIFITQCDCIESAKVLDFGVAKVWADRPDEAQFEELTRKGTVFGTPEYLAPELLGGKPATPKADQYAVGVVLYTALTGKKPFTTDPNADVPDLDLWHSVAKGAHPKPNDLRKEISPGLEEVIERAMRLNPSERFNDVYELGANLLDWASPPARHRWTAHFTSAPRSAFRASHVADGSGGASTSLTSASSTSGARTPSSRSDPCSLDVGNLWNAAGEINTATTLQQTIGPPKTVGRAATESAGESSSSNSIDARPGDCGEDVASASTILPVPARIAFYRRPATLILAGAVLLGASAVIALVLHRSKPAGAVIVAPPRAFFEPPSQTSRPVAFTAPSAPTVPPSPTAAPIAPPRSIAPDAEPSIRRKRSAKRGKPAPVLDRKGFAIPPN